MQWANANSGDPKASVIRNNIGNVPMARWFTTTSGIQSSVSSFVSAATTAGKTAVMVAYNIPGRDCGQHSSGVQAAQMLTKPGSMNSLPASAPAKPS
ncbi:MAG: glycoside hydrolase family 6 protein [Pleurocapsa sp. SU_196_0]|nr:glycoside hydrolase family 6 protein [Pleurocapsa sp. SU_196_0]